MEEKSFGRRLRATLLAVFALALFLTGGAPVYAAGPISVSGKVISATDGEPLIGASVMVKGTSTGAATDVDGNYSIKAEVGQTLVFSYVGYESRTEKITGPTLNVTLKEQDGLLDEVVVVGYGTQKKKLVTGATAQVKGDDIAKMNTTSPLQAMQGQMAGVSIASTSGQPGSDMKVTIRGLGTTGSNSPLYLIDGVGGDISTLNPNDIESIDVLKDAASAAIYGAQAANGVVLVTTKSGKQGRTQVTFDMYYGWQSAARKAEMLNAREYMTIMEEQAWNEGAGAIDWTQYANIFTYDAEGNVTGTNDTDWINTMLKDNVPTSSYTLGVSGGNDKSNYAMSIGYMNQGGIVGGPDVSDYSRYNFRINSDHKILNNLVTVGEQVSFVYKKNHGIGVGNQYNNGLRGAFGASPLLAVYNEDGSFASTTNGDWVPGGGNPYGAMVTNTNNDNRNATFNGNVYAQIEPIKGLRIRTVFGAVYGSSEYRSFSPIYNFSIYNYNEHTSVSQNMNTSLGMTWTNTAAYDFNIGKNAFNALIGMESYRYRGTYVGAGQRDLKEGFDTWDKAWIANGTASTSTDGLSASGSPHDQSRSVSYFARLGWNFDEKYMVNVTVRRDGSSRFARGHRYGTFPSVSAGWNISNEQFMENTRSWLDFLKIRASWGRVGNQSIPNYRYLAPIKNSNTHYFFGQYIGPNGQLTAYDTTLSSNWGAYPSRLGNENLKWETSEQVNIGFDATLLSSRLSVNFDYYIKNTKDWLVQAPILATAGTGAPYVNGGDVKNYGFELNLNWSDMIGKDFYYSVGLNGGWNHNEVGSIPTEDGIIHGQTNQLYDNSTEFYRAQNGHSIGYFWGYKTAGIFQNQKEIDDWAAAGNGILQASPKPGDVKYVDVDHNGVINDADKVDLGNGMPDLTYGFNINLGWKNFDLGLQAAGASGFDIVQTYRNCGDKKANYTKAILNRWTGEGTSNFLPRVTEQNYNYQFSDLFMQKGDYLRLSNITLGYDFAPLINQKWVNKARLYFQVQNAYTFTKYDGMDPEIGYGMDSWVSGVDVGYYPRPRTYIFGVNLTF